MGRQFNCRPNFVELLHCRMFLGKPIGPRAMVGVAAKMTCDGVRPSKPVSDACMLHFCNVLFRNELQTVLDRLAHRLHLPGQNRVRLPIVVVADRLNKLWELPPTEQIKPTTGGIRCGKTVGL
jgi:hypothetical protein